MLRSHDLCNRLITFYRMVGFTFRFTGALISTLLVFISVASAADDTEGLSSSGQWQWSVAPYFWLMDAELKTPVALPDGSGDPLLAELNERVDFAAQIHVEGRRDKVGFFFDISNLQLSDNIGDRRLKVKTDSGTTLLETAGFWSLFSNDSTRVELMAGIRYLNASLDLTFDLDVLDGVSTTRTVDLELLDAMAGVRSHVSVGEKWELITRADIATGGTEFSWNVSLLAARDVGRSGQFIVGYRHFDVDFDAEKELLAPTLVVNGPVIGYNFRF